MAHADAERDLTRLIVRLCVACSGLDPALDPHLNRLRNAAKAGDPAALLRQSGGAGGRLTGACPEQRARPGVLQHLLAHKGAGAAPDQRPSPSGPLLPLILRVPARVSWTRWQRSWRRRCNRRAARMGEAGSSGQARR